MPEMPMPAPGPAAGPAGAPAAPPQGKGASQIVTAVHTGLMDLMDLVSKSNAVAPEEKQELGGIISAFQSFVESLGQPPGAKKPEAAPAQGPVAPESGGNPNARPM